MITLHVGKLLEDNGYGTLALKGDEAGDNLIFIEKLPLAKEGISLMSRGDPIVRGQRISQTFDIYSRGTDDVEGYQRLEAVMEFFLKECYPSCTLPVVPDYSDQQYTRSVIMPTFNITNVGFNEEDRVIYLASAQVIYTKEN